MPITLDTGWVDAIQSIHQGSPWAWCWDFQLQVNASVNTRARLVGYHSPITLFSSVVFYPFPMRMRTISESTDEHPRLELALSNHGRVLAQYFEVVPEDEGIIGSTATAYLVKIDDSSTVRTLTFDVAGAVLDEQWATIRLEKASFLERLVPQERYNHQKCRHPFGEGTASRPSRCGYIVNAFSGFTDCTYDIDGCVARGDDEAARGLTRLHPRNFGGFLGILRQ